MKTKTLHTGIKAGIIGVGAAIVGLIVYRKRHC